MNTQPIVDSIKKQTPAAIIPEALAFAGICWVLFDKNRKSITRKRAFRQSLMDDLNVNSGVEASMQSISDATRSGAGLNEKLADAGPVLARVKSSFENLGSAISQYVKNTSHKTTDSRAFAKGMAAARSLQSGGKKAYLYAEDTYKKHPKRVTSIGAGLLAAAAVATWLVLREESGKRRLKNLH